MLLYPLDSISYEQKRNAVIQYIELYSIDEGVQVLLDILQESSDVVAEEIIADDLVKKAFRSLIKARCQKGSGQDCFSYSTLLKVGSDEELKYLNDSCYLGYEKACEKIETIKDIESEYLKKHEKTKEENIDDEGKEEETGDDEF